MVLSRMRLYPVIPIAVEFILFESHRSQFPLCRFYSLLIGVRIQLRFDPQPCSPARSPDQVHDHRTTHQRPTPPVLRDVAEHPVLDLLPLALPRRQVTDRDPQTRLIGQLLQTDLPQPIATAVAPPAIGRDQQLLRLRVDRMPHPNPPPPDRLYRELGRVVTDPYVTQPSSAV